MGDGGKEIGECETMTELEKYEIRRAYRLSKDKPAQIGILADLYATTKLEIKKTIGANTSHSKGSKYTDEQKFCFERDVRAGTDYRIAAEMHGINEATARWWKKTIFECGHIG